MIPIGTKCLVIPLEGEHSPAEGVVCDYRDPAWSARSSKGPLFGTEYSVRIDVYGGVWACFGWQLIPIGHDPDAETRTTEREATA